FFLVMHGKDVTIPKGTETTAYVDGEIKLDRARFVGGSQTAVSNLVPSQPATPATAPLAHLTPAMNMPAPQADTKVLSLVAEQPAPVSEVPHGIEGRPAASQPTPAAAVTPPHVAQTPAVEPVIPPQVAPAEKIQLTITSDPSA